MKNHASLIAHLFLRLHNPVCNLKVGLPHPRVYLSEMFQYEKNLEVSLADFQTLTGSLQVSMFANTRLD